MGPCFGEVHGCGFPRSDLQVTVDRGPIKPTLALGAGQRSGVVMVMGNLVLLWTEVNPVIKLLGAGIEITYRNCGAALPRQRQDD
jgi:hypothetical protein